MKSIINLEKEDKFLSPLGVDAFGLPDYWFWRVSLIAVRIVVQYALQLATL
jgi:hypothetical protein